MVLTVLMLPAVRFQILDPLSRRQDEHHRNDGHRTETLEGERHIFKFCERPTASLFFRQGTAQFV